MSYGYDLADRRTSMTWPDGFWVSYDHSNAGEMTAIREYGAGSGPGVLASFGYDDFGRRNSLVRGNGVATSYGYDGVSRLSSLSHDLAGGGADLTLGFSYNPASQATGLSRSNPAYAFSGRQTSDTGYGVNALNQLTSAGGVGLSYDGGGAAPLHGGR